MKIEQDIKLDFSDVLIRPKRSELNSRSEVNLVRTMRFPNSKQTWSGVPIMVANMDTTGTLEMFHALAKNRLLTCLHKFITADEIIQAFVRYKDMKMNELHPINYFILSTGISDSNWNNLVTTIEKLEENDINLRFICIDVANGYMQKLHDFCRKVRNKYPDKIIIAGNVVTREIVEELIINCGVDIVKCGIGSGCFEGSTRILMANGTYKNIADIEVGDKVINKNGKPVEVLNKMNKGFRKVVKIRTNNWHDKTTVTNNHKYWIGDLSTSSIATVKNSGKAKQLDKLSKTKPKRTKYKWKVVSELNNKSCLLMPKKYEWELNDNFTIDLKEFNMRYKEHDDYFILNGKKINRYIKSGYDLGYIFGTFLGDGHSRKTKIRNSESASSSWYFGKEERHIVDKLSKAIFKILNYEVKVEETKNMLKVHCYNKMFSKLLLQFGKRTEKHLSEKYYCKNINYIQGIFDGLVDSDGIIEITHTNNKIYCLINTSKQLLELFYWCCMNLGISYSSRKCEKTCGTLKNMNINNLQDVFRIKTHTFNRFTKDYVYSDIMEKERIEDEVEVWDIEVNCDTHSFIANNSIVHNSTCTTRLQTGVGMPQFSAVLECADAAHGLNGHIISDGGIKVVGDFSKAFGGGADFVMAGSMFAGYDESGGDIITGENGKKWKIFYGMSSTTCMNKYHGGVAKYRSSEGKTVKVPYKGAVQNQLNNIMGGIRSTCTYVGAKRLKDLPKCATFMRVNNQVNNKYSGTSHKM